MSWVVKVSQLRDRMDWVHKPHMPVAYPKLYLERARERGVPPERVLQDAGLVPEMLADPAARVSPLEFTQLVASVLRLAGDEGVGFEVGAQQPLTVADLAGQVHLSPTQFATRCREETGQSAMQWLRSLRLLQARQLRAGGLGVAETARRCGYRSPSALTAALRRDASLH